MAYAAQSDLQNVGLPAGAIQSMTPGQISACLQEASDEADTYFRARYGAANVPFIAWDTAVTGHVARIAAYRLMRVRGYKGAGADDGIRQGYEDAIDWLNRVQRQQAHPNVTIATMTAAPPQPNFVSQSVVTVATGRSASSRGW